MSKDPRTYVTLHDGMPEHPKLAGLAPATKWFLVEAITYCSRTLSDGFLPAAQIMRLGGTDADVAALTSNGRGRSPSLEVVDGGFVVHDYLEHQRSAAVVGQLRAKRADGGQTGNHRRWHAARGIVDPACALCSPSVDRSEGRSEGRSVNRRGERSSSDLPPISTVTEAVSVSPTTDLPVGGAPTPTRRTKARTSIDADWRPSPGAWSWAVLEAPRLDLDRELHQFRDHHAAKGSLMASWDAAWRTWIRNAQQFTPGPPGTAVAIPRPRPSTTDSRVAAGLQLVADLQHEEGRS